MEDEINLPLKVGQLAEAKCFLSGFRGAWFRCRIRGIAKRKGRLEHKSDYYDFPDEELKWTRLYETPPYHVGDTKERCKELMLRPHYPEIFSEKQMLHVSEISEVLVIVDNSWKVEDLVDWWCTGCYWSGRILQLLGDDKAKIELKSPPLGEGKKYKVFLKDLRPSLDWSPEHGWTIPAQEGGNRHCARLIKPINQATTDTEEPHIAGNRPDPIQCSAESSVKPSRFSPISSTSAVSDEQRQPLGETVSKKLKDEKEKIKIALSGNQADADSGQKSAEPAVEELESDHQHKNSQASERLPLNSTRWDTLEAAIIGLEGCVSIVKCLKRTLQHYGDSSCDGDGHKWKFVEANLPQ